jgi:hypothetical protein
MLSQSTAVKTVNQVSSGEANPVGWCNQAAGIVLTSAPGVGTATHIGRYEVEQTQCVDTTTGLITLGEATLIAANGDDIFMSYDGSLVPGLTPPTYDLSYVVTGGTGRFASAEGEFEIRVVFTSQTTWVSTGGGWMTYTASDRSEK